MSKPIIRLSILAAAVFVAIGVRTAAEPPENAAANDDAKPKTAEPEQKPPLKLPTRKEVMQAKLKSSQAILEGIALSDFAKIQTSAEELVAVGKATDFLNAYKGNEYLFHVELMRRPAEAIAKKAKDKNMDGVMVSFNDLTLSCLKCHQGMKVDKFEIGLKRGGTPGN